MKTLCAIKESKICAIRLYRIKRFMSGQMKLGSTLISVGIFTKQKNVRKLAQKFFLTDKMIIRRHWRFF
jgi:hypothetical protein